MKRYVQRSRASELELRYAGALLGLASKRLTPVVSRLLQGHRQEGPASEIGGHLGDGHRDHGHHVQSLQVEVRQHCHLRG